MQEECGSRALQTLKGFDVQSLVKNKRRLIEVPFNASVRDTLNTLQAHGIVAVAVAAPPGQWIGAGGSLILESDKATGIVRKQYIGLVSVLDILVHAIENDAQLCAPVCTIIGHSLEGLTLWTISPSSTIFDAMEVMSKGVHRVMVPVESHTHNTTVVELTESSPGYHMLTQTDIVKFLYDHANDLEEIMNLTVAEVGGLRESVFAVPQTMPVLDAFKCMASTSLYALAIVEVLPDSDAGPTLINGRGRRLVGSISANEVKGCTAEVVRTWSSLSVVDCVRAVRLPNEYGSNLDTCESSPVCSATTTVRDVILKALQADVHHVWVRDEEGLLIGLLSFSDILGVCRKVLSEKALSDIV